MLPRTPRASDRPPPKTQSAIGAWWARSQRGGPCARAAASHRAAGRDGAAKERPARQVRGQPRHEIPSLDIVRRPLLRHLDAVRSRSAGHSSTVTRMRICTACPSADGPSGSAAMSTRRNRPVSNTRLRAWSDSSALSGAFSVSPSARTMTSVSMARLPATTISPSTCRTLASIANVRSTRGPSSPDGLPRGHSRGREPFTAVQRDQAIAGGIGRDGSDRTARVRPTV